MENRGFTLTFDVCISIDMNKFIGFWNQGGEDRYLNISCGEFGCCMFLSNSNGQRESNDMLIKKIQLNPNFNYQRLGNGVPSSLRGYFEWSAINIDMTMTHVLIHLKHQDIMRLTFFLEGGGEKHIYFIHHDS